MIKFTGENSDKISYKTLLSAGFDIPANEDSVIEPGEFRAVSTGLFIEEIHESLRSPVRSSVLEIQIRPRSGLAFKYGVTVLNAPGTIDCDYRDEIKVILVNHGKEAFHIKKGDRIAQGVFSFVFRPDSIPVDDILRNGGFGSTGKVA